MLSWLLEALEMDHQIFDVEDMRQAALFGAVVALIAMTATFAVSLTAIYYWG